MAVLLAAALTFAAPAAVPFAVLAAQDTTTTAPPKKVPLFTWRDAALLSGYAASALLIAPLDKELAYELQDSTVQTNKVMKDVAAVVRDIATPGSVIIGVSMYGFGRLTGNEKAADLGLHGTEALFVGELVAVGLKGIFGRARPYDNIDDPTNFKAGRGFGGESRFRSFPSGHTTAAFAAAAAVTAETRRWWPKSVYVIGPLMYGGAAMAGMSRMYHNRHWASDVVVGAAIGTFAGIKVVRWHHTHPNNVIDRLLLGKTVVNTPAGATTVRFVVVPQY